MATKKDFQAAAEALAETILRDWNPYADTSYGPDYREVTEALLCKIFRSQNQRFDSDRFHTAVSKALGES